MSLSHTPGTVRVDTPKASLSIRARLVVLALLAMVPLMLDRVRLLEANRAERIGAAYASALGLARRGADSQREVVTAVKSVLQVMARARTVTADGGDACGESLAAAAADVSWIRGLSIIGTNGRVTCSTFANAVGLDVSDRPYVRDALETGRFVLSDYLVGRVQGAPTIVATVPYRGADGRIDGVITAGVDLPWVGRLAEAAGHQGQGAVLLIDDHGVILAAYPNGEKWSGRRAGELPVVKAMLRSNEGTVTGADPDGVRRMFGFLRLPGAEARLAIGFDERVIVAQVDREIGIAYLQLGFVGIIVLMLVWFGGDRLIVQPIRSLARIATRIGRGDLEARAGRERWAAEFAPLAVAIDDMAGELATREAELRRANRHLQELATIDGLSGLANRRGFDERLDLEWSRAGAEQRQLALLMIDADYFKLFNDTHGHVEGDACLKMLGNVFALVAKSEGGLAARYGGEEFALLLPGTDTAGATEIAERVRKAVEDLRIVNAAAPTGRVTVSIGAASVRPRHEVGHHDLVEAADVALYAAKREGRNRVVAGAAERAPTPQPQLS